MVDTSCFTSSIDLTSFKSAVSSLMSDFPFVFLSWLYNLFSSLIAIQPQLPNVSFNLFFFTVNPFGFLVDYSNILNPLMSFIRWTFTLVFVVGFVKSYLDRWL